MVFLTWLRSVLAAPRRADGLALSLVGGRLKIVVPRAPKYCYIDRIFRVIESCHTLDQLSSCSGWVDRVARAGALSVSEALYVRGAIKATEHWLARRYGLQDQAELS
jgi:hypothetical protein